MTSMVIMKIPPIRSKKGFVAISILVAIGIVSTYPLSIVTNDLLYFGSTRCDVPTLSDAHIIDVRGFLANNLFNRGGDEANSPSLNDFLLMPGTTGYITINYDYSRQGSVQAVYKQFDVTPAEAILRDINSTELWKVNGINSYEFISPKELGIHIYPVKMADINPQVMQITFAITADSSAQRGTYGVPVFDICGKELLTIGYWPYLY